MAKNAITDYDTDPANNTVVGGIGIQGNNIPSNFDNALRQIMSHLRTEHDAVYALLGENRIINGGFTVNQDAVSGTVVLAAGDYGHDMWKAGSSGCTYTFATVNNVTTITITAGSLQQIVRGAFLDSGTHCLSWTGTAQGKIDSGSYGDTGVTGTATGGTNLTVEFGTGTLSNVSLIEGSIPATYKRRLTPHEEYLCFYSYEKITLLKTLQVGIYNDEMWRVRKPSTPIFTASGATFASTYADTEGWNVTVGATANVFITVSADARL